MTGSRDTEPAQSPPLGPEGPGLETRRRQVVEIARAHYRTPTTRNPSAIRSAASI